MQSADQSHCPDAARNCIKDTHNTARNCTHDTHNAARNCTHDTHNAASNCTHDTHNCTAQFAYNEFIFLLTKIQFSMLITNGKDPTIEDDKWNGKCFENFCKYK